MSVNKERVCVFFKKPYLDGMDQLVEEGLFMERADLIRHAVYRLLETHRVPPFYLEAKHMPEEEAEGVE